MVRILAIGGATAAFIFSFWVDYALRKGDTHERTAILILDLHLLS
jgi:hypothetical protein